MKVGVFWETSPGAPKKKLTSIFEAKSEKIELFSCKEWFLLEREERETKASPTKN